jgi:starvation-inducible DNA-binding protein
MFTASDEIAERIRALDAYAIGGLGALADQAKLKEFSSPMSQEAYVKALIAGHEKVVTDAAKAREIADQSNDPESEDLMIQRITLHEKSLWMLRSFLKS